MVLPLLPGCAPCGVRFFRFPEEPERHFASIIHRAVSHFRLRECSYISENSSLNPVPVLEQFRHLPRLGQHQCQKCGLVVLVSVRDSLEAIAGELAAHLESREHQSLQFREARRSSGELPPRIVPLDFHKYVCYACKPIREFESFLDACEHSDEVHCTVCDFENKSRSVNIGGERYRGKFEYGFTTPLPDFMEANPDGCSRLCKLCNVTVWSEDDPHLTGKRHRKALEQLHAEPLFDDSELV